VAAAGIGARPYIVALRGFVPEVVLFMRKKDGEKHRPLEFPGAESAQFLGFPGDHFGCEGASRDTRCRGSR
jgi:hypothetical protein